MSIKLLMFIALGGAAGAVGRYTATVAVTHWTGNNFPFGTLVVNTLGSFLLGCLLAGLAFGWSPSNEMRSLLQVGLIGAFTTFSAFSMDTYNHISRGDYLGASLYVGGSVILGFFALILGVALIRQLFS